MIVWLNGAFGTGKTSAARELVDLWPGSTLYDPELTGLGLVSALPAERLRGLGDFQDLPSWRRLVVDTAAALLMETRGPLVVPMTLLRQAYRDEIFGGLAARGISVRHVLLHPEETILRRRIEDRAAACPDPGEGASGREWSLGHLNAYREALPWLTADAHVVDTGGLTPRGAAARIAEAVDAGAGACPIVQTPPPSGETLAAGVLLFDDADRVLLVDPTYKPGWEFPGGVVERGERPTGAALREVAEELGIELRAPDGLELLVVDWEPPSAPRHGGLRLLFDGGTLSGERASTVLLPAAELREWRFVTEAEAAGMLPPERFARLHWALRARAEGRAVNLEDGRPAARSRLQPELEG